MGNGTFSNMVAHGDDDWRRIHDQIQSTNATDKAKRSCFPLAVSGED